MTAREYIREALETIESPDPHERTAEIVATLPAEHIDALVEKGVLEIVMEESRARRNRWSGPGVVGGQGVSKWELALRDPVPALGEWKYLEDCTAEDLNKIADDYEATAAKYGARGLQVRGFARLLEQSGYGTFGEMVRAQGEPVIESLAA